MNLRFLTRELGIEMCNLTLLILTKESNTESYFFEKSLSIKVYNLIKSLQKLLKENIEDVTYPLFFFLNLATKKEFHLIIGHYLENNLSLEDFLSNFLNNFSFLLNYVRVYIPFFLDMLIFYIYDVDASILIKRLCFSVVMGLLSETARFNAFLLKESSFIEKVLFYLRIEKDDFLKKCFLKLIKSFLKDNFTLKILIAFLRFYL